MCLYNWKGENYKKRRFGCWICTVIRKDKAMEGLINEGFTELKYLFRYRNWLMQIRDIPSYRHKKRRNGTNGLGPFTLPARRKILRKLLEVQRKVPWKLIEKSEIEEIKKIWKLEKKEAVAKSD